LEEEFEINFDTMKTSDDCLKIKEIRRVSALNSKWLWYYQNENDEWIEYNDNRCSSNDIENQYKNYLENKKAIKQYPFSGINEINFEKMIENTLKDRMIVTRKIRRRPLFVGKKEDDQKRYSILTC
jgi:hypothetical protein